MPLTDAERRYLAELAAADEAVRAEHQQWLARRGAIGGAYVRPPPRPGIVYREYDGGALADTLRAAAGASDAEAGFSEEQLEQLAHVVAEVQKQFEHDLERVRMSLLQTIARLVMPGERAEETFYALRDRVARMERQLERQLSQAMVELKSGNATAVANPESDVVDLPNWRRHDA
jgi:hypothetical protein